MGHMIAIFKCEYLRTIFMNGNLFIYFKVHTQWIPFGIGNGDQCCNSSAVYTGEWVCKVKI